VRWVSVAYTYAVRSAGTCAFSSPPETPSLGANARTYVPYDRRVFSSDLVSVYGVVWSPLGRLVEFLQALPRFKVPCKVPMSAPEHVCSHPATVLRGAIDGRVWVVWFGILRDNRH
jgi:hypothetical protein